MILIDRVVQGSMVTVIKDKSGGLHAMPGPGTFAERLRACPLRYVLDRPASRQCSSLFRGGGDIPRLEDPLTRLPAESFWLESFGDPDSPSGQWHEGRRLGFLCEAEDQGRTGRITFFGEDLGGEPVYLGGSVVFGMDGALPKPCGIRFNLNTVNLPEVADLLRCARLEISETHKAVYSSSHDTMVAMTRLMGDTAWCALPMILSFSALLNSNMALSGRPSDLARLNAARRKSGRPELLDHVAVRLDLSPRSDREHTGGADVGNRRTPRLHYVRGHRVQRAGKTFWRSSHLRGEGEAAPIRTVNVTASRPMQHRRAIHAPS